MIEHPAERERRHYEGVATGVTTTFTVPLLGDPLQHFK